jgi:GH15 family glucan-1,4-alpha-glucosidase
VADQSSKLIEDYALIGDLQTAALVALDGSIDWLCLPYFDDPACFAALLHDESAGHWTIALAAGGCATFRSYDDDSLVLRTRWESEAGVVEVVDFMPPRGEAADVVRVVEGVSGVVAMESVMRLRFDYGRVRPWVRSSDGDGDGDSLRADSRWSGHAPHLVSAVAGPDAVWIRSDVPLRDQGEALQAAFTVEAGERVAFVLTHQRSHLPKPVSADPEQALTETRQFWSDWIGQTAHEGPWAAEVRRSLLLLKALTFAPTGGIVAAATTSLPEEIGGVRNWDYRFCWLRDSTFTLQALLAHGYIDEARAWREWLVRAVAGDPAKLQIMYGLDGTRRLPEMTLDWLDGYEGSRPVRIGNGAAGQLQLDVWGEVLDGLHLAREAGLEFSEPAWDLQVALLDWLAAHWHEPDNGLWEMRGPRRHFVHSKVMAWVGFDRAIHSVEHHGLDGDVATWREVADRIHAEVCDQGFDPERNTFTQFYGSRGLDASLLLIPRVGFLAWDDPRVVGTVEAVAAELAGDGFVHRYDTGADGGPDGLPGGEASFLACSFWLVDALHGIGETERAEELFSRLLTVRNDVGILPEEYDTRTGRHLGNTPQAFSLVGLLNSARHLRGGGRSDSRDACC